MRSFVFSALSASVLLASVLYGSSASAVDAKDFFAEPAMSLPAINPSGQYVVSQKRQGDAETLSLYAVKPATSTTLLSLDQLSDSEAHVRSIDWIDDEHIAVQLFENKKGIEDVLDTRTISRLLIIKLQDGQADADAIVSVRTKGWLINPLPEQAGTFLYAKSGIQSKIYKIDVHKLAPFKAKLNKLSKIDGGQFTKSNEVSSIKGFAVRWFKGQGEEPSAVLHYKERNKLYLSTFDEEGVASELKHWLSEDLQSTQANIGTSPQLIPVSASDEANSFYALDINEDDERSVYKVNYETGEHELVLAVDSFKIVDLVVDDDSSALVGVKVLQNANIETIYLDPSQNAGRSQSTSKFRTAFDSSIDKRHKLVYSEAHDAPGRYVIIDDDSKKTQALGSVFPQLDGELSSIQLESSHTVDGLDIPYLLTLPKTTASSPHPLILMPHGGPIDVYDNRYFDLGTQFFVANGYAVLRVNFRGSSGYSKQLKEAAKGHWELLLNDIYQVTKHVTQRDDIDAQRICALGMSYGGYAASQLAVEHPSLLRCAVNIAGISDVNLYLNSPYATKVQLAWLQDWVGDSQTDYERFKSASPAFRAGEVTIPTLVLHGAKDRVVDVEHAYRLVQALRVHGKPVDWHIYPELGHSLDDINTVRDVYQRSLDFLDANL